MATDNIEKKFYEWVSDVSDRIGADRVGSILGGAVVGVARTKATFDKNFDALLQMANIPSRGDYQRMQDKLDSLQGSVISLSRTVEQLRDAIANGSGKHKASASVSRKRAPSRSATKAKPKSQATTSRPRTAKKAKRAR